MSGWVLFPIISPFFSKGCSASFWDRNSFKWLYDWNEKEIDMKRGKIAQYIDQHFFNYLTEEAALVAADATSV